MLAALSAEQVDYLLVGAHALAAHGVIRYSQDIDLWVRPDPENALRVYRALAASGAPLEAHGVRPEDFAVAGAVYQIGVKPFRIDILTSVSGLTFDDAWSSRERFELGGTSIWVPSVADLIANKRACGRLEDLADVGALEEMHPDAVEGR